MKLPDTTWIAIAIAALMFSAFLPLPWTHHTILRLAGFAGSIMFAVLLWRPRRPISYLMIAGAILFNPIQPIHLPGRYWMVIYLAAGVSFACLAWLAFRIEGDDAG
jgi:hypothetical protein